MYINNIYIKQQHIYQHILRGKTDLITTEPMLDEVASGFKQKAMLETVTCINTAASYVVDVKWGLTFTQFLVSVLHGSNIGPDWK